MITFFKQKGFLSRDEVFTKIKEIYDITVKTGFLIFKTEQQQTYIGKTDKNEIVIINDNLGDVILAIRLSKDDFEYNIEKNSSYFNNLFWKFYIDGLNDGFYVNRNIYTPKKFEEKINELVH